jgi:hypothetical protein
MAKRILPTPETIAALAEMLDLDNLKGVRSIKISIKGGEPVTVDVEMFVWDQDRLTSVIERLTADTDRVTNVKVETTPALAEQVGKVNVQSVADPEPVYFDGAPCS